MQVRARVTLGSKHKTGVKGYRVSVTQVDLPAVV